MPSDDIDDDSWMEGGDALDTEPVKGVMWTKTQLASIMGFSPKTLTKFIAEGMPAIIGESRREGWRVNSVKFQRWHTRYVQQQMLTDPDASGLEIAQLKDKEAQTRQRELQIAKMEGSLVPVDLVATFVSKKFGDARSRMLAVRSQITGLNDDQKEQLDAAIHDAMEDVTGDNMEEWINGTATAERDSESA